MRRRTHQLAYLRPGLAWPARATARQTIVDYIAWYNGTRLHSALGHPDPHR